MIAQEVPERQIGDTTTAQRFTIQVAQTLEWQDAAQMSRSLGRDEPLCHGEP